MAEAVQWLDGKANVASNVEKICPKKHIRQNQWQNEWNEEYLTPLNHCTYDYISDYECVFKHPIDADDNQVQWVNLQTAKQQGTNISITNLAHFTSPENAGSIIGGIGGFRGGMKKINEDAQGDDIIAKFSWWSPIFTEDDKKQVRGTLGAAIQPFLGQGDNLAKLKNQFATSDAFTPNQNRYGTSYFQYGINALCPYYGNQFRGKLQYKILGTFGYKQEVMHAVLVCSQADGAGRFGAYPPVLTPEEDVNHEAVVTRDENGSWTWKPQATGTKIRRLHAHLQNYPMYRRWEHVAFAFHIPEEWGIDPANETFMDVPDLQDHLHDLPVQEDQ